MIGIPFSGVKMIHSGNTSEPFIYHCIIILIQPTKLGYCSQVQRAVYVNNQLIRPSQIYFKNIYVYILVSQNGSLLVSRLSCCSLAALHHMWPTLACTTLWSISWEGCTTSSPFLS